jgi:predicted transcriptional regulator
MTTTFDTLANQIRQQPDDAQEVVGRFMQASLQGERVTLADIEDQYRAEQTKKGLADVEAGRVMSVDEARQSLAKVAEELSR